MSKDYHRSERLSAVVLLCVRTEIQLISQHPWFWQIYCLKTVILTGPFYLCLFKINPKSYSWKAWWFSENKKKPQQTVHTSTTDFYGSFGSIQFMPGFIYYGTHSWEKFRIHHWNLTVIFSHHFHHVVILRKQTLK